MSTKYPLLLVHGIVLKDVHFFKAFGKIESILTQHGYTVSTSRTDGFGSIENNAAQLKEHIEEILRKTGAEKINLIAHSKGGLDSRYMIDKLGMRDKVASVTFLCTPHKGSPVATMIDGLPRPIKGIIAGVLNAEYRIFGDKNPDALTVCRQLRHAPDGLLDHSDNYDGIFLQSYSTTLKRSRDDFVMGIPLRFSHYLGDTVSDGLVSAESSKFANYRGNCTDDSVSHSEIVDFMTRKQKKEKIYAFYLSLCKELAERGL